MGSAEMSGNGNKGTETAPEAQPRVALARVGAVVGDIFGSNRAGGRGTAGTGVNECGSEPCNGENRSVINIMI